MISLRICDRQHPCSFVAAFGETFLRAQQTGSVVASELRWYKPLIA